MSTLSHSDKQKNHQSLTDRLNAKILKYIREQSQYPLNSKVLPSVQQLYTLLQERDPQLRRIKKPQLDLSIQRALNIIQKEDRIDSEDDLLDSDFDGLEDLNLVEVKVNDTWKVFDTRMRILSISSSQVNGLLLSHLLNLLLQKFQQSGSKSGPGLRILRDRRVIIFLFCLIVVASEWTPPTSVSLRDLGGINNCIQEILEVIVMPLKHPEIYQHVGIPPPR